MAARSKSHSQTEQSGSYSAAPTTIEAFATLNQQYEERFGFRFLVYTSGKTADEMLAALAERLNNTPEDEFRIAGGERIRINESRLRKVIREGADAYWLITNDDDRNAQEMLDTSTRARTYMSCGVRIRR